MMENNYADILLSDRNDEDSYGLDIEDVDLVEVNTNSILSFFLFLSFFCINSQ